MRKITNRVSYLILVATSLLFIAFLNACDIIGTKQPSQYLAVNGVKPSEEEFAKIAELFSENNGEISIGVGFIESYLRNPSHEIAERLKEYMSLSEKYNVPLIIQIDGENWWQNRPDLWNWWDPSKPGYNPDNRYNVEWTDWTPDSAVKIGWRNWGRQLRVLPMPNLMSPKFREACLAELKVLVPIIVDWYKGLPKDKKHLFIGLKVGWESSIGVNNWYYPGGNDLLDKPVENDPKYGLTNYLLPDRGVTAIGYSAVTAAGLANSGPLKEEHLTEIVRMHLEDYSKIAYELGVPRDRLFTHCGGWAQGETLYTAAVNEYSCPGWSYYKYATDIKQDTTSMNALKLSDAPYWGAVEYLLMGDKSIEDWYSSLNNAFELDKMRYLCIYNWGGIKNNENAIKGIQMLLMQEKNE